MIEMARYIMPSGSKIQEVASLQKVTDDIYKSNGCYHIQSKYHPLRQRWVLDRIVDAMVLVDLGCGDGSLGKLALEEGRTGFYVGMDFSQSALELAAEKLQSLGRFMLVLGDITDTYHNLPLEPYSCSAVTLVEVLEHTNRPNRVLAGACHLLMPGGALLITSPVKKDMHDPLAISYTGMDGVRKVLDRNKTDVVEECILYSADETQKYTEASGRIFVKHRPPRPLSYLVMAVKRN